MLLKQAKSPRAASFQGVACPNSRFRLSDEGRPRKAQLRINQRIKFGLLIPSLCSFARRTIAYAGLLTALGTQNAKADGGIWSATLYAGPGTDHNSTQLIGEPIILYGHNYGSGFTVDNVMLGLAVDRRLVSLGWGFSLATEGQLTAYAFGHPYGTGALGLGFQFNGFPWNAELPTTISGYTGPSYAVNPPRAPLFKGKALLNYVGIELAIAIPDTHGWDVVGRVYHRSGVWGVYSLADDEGTMIGIGVRKRF